MKCYSKRFIYQNLERNGRDQKKPLYIHIKKNVSLKLSVCDHEEGSRF